MKLELSQVLTIGTMIAVLSGFYYTTQHRLTHLEEQLEDLRREDVKLRRLINKKRLKK
tara:strand:+ start:222 stop:395 length:174 start_codon:yes stop_codon:yes gene_type:complete